MIKKILSNSSTIYYVLGFAFLIRVLVYFAVNINNYNFGDTAHYIQVAKNIADGKGFTIFNTDEVAVDFKRGFKSLSYSQSDSTTIDRDLYYYGIAPYGKPFTFWDPLLPYLMALFYMAGDKGFVFFNLAGCIIGALSCFLLFKLGEIIFNRTVGLIAAFIMMLEFNSIFYSSILMTENISIFLLLCVFILIYKSVDKPKIFYLLLTGFLVGLSYLQRANLLILLPIVLIYIYSRLGRQLKIKVFYILIGFIIASAPWWTRNIINTGHIGFLPTKGVFNIWKTSVAMGSIADYYGIDLRRDFFNQRQHIERSVKYPEAMYISGVEGSTEFQRAASLRKNSLTFMRMNTGLVLKMYLTNIAKFFNPFPIFGNSILKLYLICFYLFVLILGIMGLYLAYKNSIPIAPFVIYIFLFTIAAGIFRLGFRFRMPIMPVFMLMCGYFLYLMLNKSEKG